MLSRNQLPSAVRAPREEKQLRQCHVQVTEAAATTAVVLAASQNGVATARRPRESHVPHVTAAVAEVISDVPSRRNCRPRAAVDAAKASAPPVYDLTRIESDDRLMGSSSGASGGARSAGVEEEVRGVDGDELQDDVIGEF